MTTSTASMRHIILNKENPNELAASTICQPSENVPSSVSKRKALGDVMNTTTNRNGIGMTPKGVKANMSSILSSNTPKIRAKLGFNTALMNSANVKATQNDTPKCTVKAPMMKTVVNQKDVAPPLPPVEKFYPAPMDTFKDIFDSNSMRLNEIFLDKNVKFVGRLPTGGQKEKCEEKYHTFEVESDKLWNKKAKKLTKSMKKKENSELNRFGASSKSSGSGCIQIWHDVPDLVNDLPDLDLIDSD